jgi:hypothetical protein
MQKISPPSPPPPSAAAKESLSEWLREMAFERVGS